MSNLLNDVWGSLLWRRYICSAKVSNGAKRNTDIATSLKPENMMACVACLEISSE